MDSGHTPHQGGEHKSHLPGLEGFFDTYLRIKAPFQLPAGAKEWIVKYGPWIMLVLIVISAFVIIPMLLVALGLRTATVQVQMAYGVQTAWTGMGTMGWVKLAGGLIALVMEAIAIPSLMKRKLSGWKLVYYAGLVSAVCSILTFDIIGFVLGLVIGMYFLFQIRSYYK